MSDYEHLVENVFQLVKRKGKQGVDSFDTDYFTELSDDLMKKEGLNWLLKNGKITISKETLMHLLNLSIYVLYEYKEAFEWYDKDEEE